MRKQIQDVLSGEQIVTAGRRDRVDGVSDPTNGQVTVYSERGGVGHRYDVGTEVEVVR